MIPFYRRKQYTHTHTIQKSSRETHFYSRGSSYRSCVGGGGNLVVPEEWNVETKIAGLGGIGDARPQRDRSPEAPTLRVEGIALFGGWGITSEPADEGRDEVLAPV